MSFLSAIFGPRPLPQKKYSTIDYNSYFGVEKVVDTPVTYRDLGELRLTSGKIIACDPLAYLHDSPAFNGSVRPGKYPVSACVVEDRHAVVKVEFSKGKAEKWELAVAGKQDVVVLKEDEFFGFPVDAGMSCFCDLDAQKPFNSFYNSVVRGDAMRNIYDDYFAAEFKKNAKNQDDPDDIGDWLNFTLPNRPDLNVVMFSSGYGDGAYPCYWGIGNGGEICSLVVDFHVL